MPAGDNAASGYTEPATPNKYLDAEDTGRTQAGMAVLVQRVKDVLVAERLATLNGKDFATQATLAAVLTELGQKLEPADLATLATEAKVEAVRALLAGTLVVRDDPRATRVDEASATVTYIGSSVAGTAGSAAAWQIKKVDTSSGTTITFADGNALFDNVWNDRASLTYS